MKITPRRLPLLPQAASSARQLAVARTALATVFMVAPVASARLLGTDTATARRVTWLTRMMAVRDATLGVGAARALRDGDPRPWLVAGAISDAVDAAVIAGALKQGRVRGVLPTLVVPGAALAAASGIYAAARFGRD